MRYPQKSNLSACSLSNPAVCACLDRSLLVHKSQHRLLSLSLPRNSIALSSCVAKTGGNYLLNKSIHSTKLYPVETACFACFAYFVAFSVGYPAILCRLSCMGQNKRQLLRLLPPVAIARELGRQMALLHQSFNHEKYYL